MAVRLRARRDTLANWQSANPILGDGEFAVVKDGSNQGLKLGDGASAFNDLAYWNPSIIVDNLTSIATDQALSANQGKVLKGLIDQINTVLLSDTTTLDTIQEIVDFIELNKSTLDTLGIANIAGLQTALDSKESADATILKQANIVDALTSISTTQPLSANQGKVLKGLIDNINTILSSDDTTLDELQEVVNFIKANKSTLDTLGIANIAGLTDALNLKANLSGATFTGAITIDTVGRALEITGDTTLDDADAWVYIGNGTDEDSGYGYIVKYEGTGSGNTNALVIASTGANGVTEILRSNIDGIVNLPQIGAKVAGNTIHHAGNFDPATKIDKVASTDNGIARFNGTSGDIQNTSQTTINDDGDLWINGSINASSNARFQVNGFMRVGAVFLHDVGTGNDPIENTGLALRNEGGVLEWNNKPLVDSNGANFTGDINFGTYGKLIASGKDATSQLTFNVITDNAADDTYTPNYTGAETAGMTVVRMPSGGLGGLEFYTKKSGTDDTEHNIDTFKKNLSLTVDGYVGIGTNTPNATLEINKDNSAIGTTTIATTRIVHPDAHLDIVSSPDASWGSVINLIEGSTTDATNVDIWSIGRTTTGGGSELYFNYGTDNTHGNPNKVKFSKDGDITVTGDINLDTVGQKISFGKEAGKVGYIKHIIQGQLDIGSDDQINFRETDNDEIAVRISTNNKTIEASNGVIMSSPNGTRYKLTVEDDGSLTTTAI